MNQQLQAIATVLPLINPVICGLMFTNAAAGAPRQEQLLEATRTVLAVLAVLVGAALAGTRVLALFGVSLEAFTVAGGGVLAWMGFSMLTGKATPGADHADCAGAGQQASLTSLVLFAASPGTITGVITISAAHTGLHLPVTALVAIAVASAVTWLVMVFSARVAGGQRSGGFIGQLMQHLMGLIVLAMGVQFALSGYHAFAAQ